MYFEQLEREIASKNTNFPDNLRPTGRSQFVQVILFDVK